jgi:mannose-1-phosphate guanylyltransferase
VTPELAGLLPLLDADDVKEYFAVAPSLSIDEGVLERSGRVGVMDATFDWDDVGTWDAVARTRQSADADGNVVEGMRPWWTAPAAWSGTREAPVVLFGARDLVVAQVHGVTLVLPRDRAADLKIAAGRPAARDPGGGDMSRPALVLFDDAVARTGVRSP